jgi:hypothetical protein
LVSLQDIEAIGLSSLGADSAVSRAATVPSSDADVPDQVNSVFDFESDEFFSRLMRMFDFAGRNVLGGPFCRGEVEDDSSSGDTGLQFYDLNQFLASNLHIADFQPSYRVGFADTGFSTIAPYTFSGWGEFPVAPAFSGGGAGGSTGSASANSGSSDTNSNSSYRSVSYSPAPSGAPSPMASGSFIDPTTSGPNVAMATQSASAPQVASNDASAGSNVLGSPSLSISVVPEPTTACMAVFALGFLGLRRRRA